MGARRKQVKQKTRLRYRRWYLPLVIAALAVTGWQVSERMPSEIMPIDNVQIEGSFIHLSRSDIRQQLMQGLTGDYFTADIDALRLSLLSLPWVQNASIRRQWPSTLRIRIIEKRPVAYWSDDSLLSDQGELFSPSHIYSEMQIPVIEGPAGLHQKVWGFFVSLQKELSPLGLGVQKLVLDERRSWSMLLSNGVELQLGRNDTEKRIQRFIKVFSMQNAPNIDDIKYIDLRYPNGFAMKSRTVAEEESDAGLDSISGWSRHV